jgi:hypothetical protein
MSVDWGKAVKDYFGEQPHPRGHGLKIREVLPAVKLATMMKFGGHATLHEARMFWDEFAPGGVPMMSPQDFEHALDKIAPVSYSFHGRPPTLKEVGELSSKAAHEIHKYFSDLPSKERPEISAGDYVKAYQKARPWAREHLGREPVSVEAAHLHHSGERPDVYYQRLGAQNTRQGGTQAPVGTDAGVRGVDPARRQATDQ